MPKRATPVSVHATCEARHKTIEALKALDASWSPSVGLTVTQLDERWAELVGEPPSRALSEALVAAFKPARWRDEQGEGLRVLLLESRAALWGRLQLDLARALLPATLRWRASDGRGGLPDALCAALPYLGVTVEDERGCPYLCRPKEASRSLREGLADFARLFDSSLAQARPFSLRPQSQEGLRLEALILCVLNTPMGLLSELDERYVTLFNETPACELIARPSGLYDDLALSRDLSLKRAPDPSRALPAARGWVQVGLTALATDAERKAHVARRRGGALTLTPHHLAFSCPAGHPLWRYHDHIPRTHEGRALAIRGMLRRALAVRPQGTPKGALSAPLAPLLELPPPLVWQIICDAQLLIDRPARGGRR